MNEILYQVVAIDSDLIKNYPDKVTFISKREDMSDGILYNDYDFKNHRYIKTYVSDNFNIYDRLEEKDKYKNVIDKIKEYTKITSKLKYENEYVGLFVKDICNDILELLEEVE